MYRVLENMCVGIPTRYPVPGRDVVMETVYRSIYLPPSVVLLVSSYLLAIAIARSVVI